MKGLSARWDEAVGGRMGDVTVHFQSENVLRNKSSSARSKWATSQSAKFVTSYRFELVSRLRFRKRSSSVLLDKKFFPLSRRGPHRGA